MTLSEIDLKTLNNPIEEALLIPFKNKKKKSRKERRHELLNEHKFNLNLKHVDPLTENQKTVFKCWDEGYNLFLHGLAGTGKSYISLFLALRELQEHRTCYKHVLIVRSAVPTRDIGFLPGTLKEKTKIYELPYQIICNELYGRGDAYEILKNKQAVEFTTTSFIRGNTFHDTIVIVDETNNMTFHELDSIITRLGDNCRIIFCGDYRQSDLYNNEKNGIHTFIKVIDKMKDFAHIEFEINDIVRSGIVKEYIIAKHKLGIT